MNKVSKLKKAPKTNIPDIVQLQDFQNGRPITSPTNCDYNLLKQQILSYSKKMEEQQPEYARYQQEFESQKKKQKQKYLLPGQSNNQNQAVKYGKPKKVQNKQSNQKVKPKPSNVIEGSKKKSIKKTPIPQMLVACDSCTIKQYVPGNTQIFSCICCLNLNQCYPLYGIFICCSCNSRVCYPFSVSQFIKCSKCNTVNKVPFQPIKNYRKDIQQEPQHQNNNISVSDRTNDFFSKGHQNQNAQSFIVVQEQIYFSDKKGKKNQAYK